MRYNAEQSMAARAWVLCCEAGAEYGLVGYEACRDWCLSHADVHDVDTLTRLWQTQDHSALYTTSEYGTAGVQPIQPTRRAMYSELARASYLHVAARPVFDVLKTRADSLARARRNASIKHNLAPMYYALANDVKRLMLAFPDVVPGDSPTRRATILDYAALRAMDITARRQQREEYARFYHSQPERQFKQRAREAVPSGRTDEIKRLMR